MDNTQSKDSIRIDMLRHNEYVLKNENLLHLLQTKLDERFLPTAHLTIPFELVKLESFFDQPLQYFCLCALIIFGIVGQAAPLALDHDVW